MLKESFVMSWQNIVSNKMRSFLTTLGIIIGVLSIITIVTLMQGASEQVSREFASLGAEKISISALGTALKKGLSPADIEKFGDIDHVVGVSPSVSLTTSVVSDGNITKDASIEGKNEYYFRQSANDIILGRGLNYLDVESKNNVCVIDRDSQKTFFFGQDPIGKTIIINSMSFKVVGVINDSFEDLASSLNLGKSTTTKIMIPYTTAMKMLNNHNVNSVELYIENTSYKDQVTSDARQVLNQAFNYKEDSFSILKLDSIVDSMKTITSMLSSILGGIASIALLVGGIGIMNMMLVSVTERTKEIGLKKALGAEPRKIQLQFLIESVLLSLIGGFIGLGLGLLISWGICAAIKMAFVISIKTVLLAVGFSAGVGIIFGWAPARKASMLNPIDALRSE